MKVDFKEIAPNPLAALQCGPVRKIEYYPAHRTGMIYMEPDCCTDMEGAIALFERIDPKVKVIRTFAGAAVEATKHDLEREREALRQKRERAAEH